MQQLCHDEIRAIWANLRSGPPGFDFSSAAGGEALSTLKVYIRTHSSATYREVALTEEAYVLDYTASIDTLAADAGGIIRVDVRGLNAVKFTATTASGTADITVYGSRS